MKWNGWAPPALRYGHVCVRSKGLPKRLPCEMKHIITFESSHHNTCAGYRMPLCLCQRSTFLPLFTTLSHSLYMYRKKGLHGATFFFGQELSGGQLWFVRVNCEILFDMPRASKRGFDYVCPLQSGHKKWASWSMSCELWAVSWLAFRWSNPIIKNFKLCTMKRTLKAHTRTRLLAH